MGDGHDDIFGDFASLHQKQVTLHLHGQGDKECRTLTLQTDWSMDHLLSAVGKRLGLEATPTKLFNSDGMEITDVIMIDDDALLLVSEEEDFQPNKGDHEHGALELDEAGIPRAVGGYEVLELLGKGGFGEVRLGKHSLTGERVALKFMEKTEISDMGAAERTTNEIQCLTALRHPNIIRLLQHANTPSHVLLVFELMEGGDMLGYLEERGGVGIGEEEVRKLFNQILQGMSYAHNRHICHRDMKLDNVLLAKAGCLDTVKIADFGLSYFFRPGATMISNCGSISYMAPEVFRGTASSGPPLDVWSMGVILFAMLCGRLPFEPDGDSVEGSSSRRDDSESAIRKKILNGQYKIHENLSAEARDLIRRMLKADPRKRATIPEMFSHCWLQARNNPSLDTHLQEAPEAREPPRDDELGSSSRKDSSRDSCRSKERKKEKALAPLRCPSRPRSHLRVNAAEDCKDDRDDESKEEGKEESKESFDGTDQEESDDAKSSSGSETGGEENGLLLGHQNSSWSLGGLPRGIGDCAVSGGSSTRVRQGARSPRTPRASPKNGEAKQMMSRSLPLPSLGSRSPRREGDSRGSTEDCKAEDSPLLASPRTPRAESKVPHLPQSPMRCRGDEGDAKQELLVSPRLSPRQSTASTRTSRPERWKTAPNTSSNDAPGPPSSMGSKQRPPSPHALRPLSGRSRPHAAPSRPETKEGDEDYGVEAKESNAFSLHPPRGNPRGSVSPLRRNHTQEFKGGGTPDKLKVPRQPEEPLRRGNGTAELSPRLLPLAR